MNKIYCIEFADGKKYIGLTRRNVKERIQHHRNPNQFSNWDLHEKINAEAYTVSVIEEHECPKEAKNRELELIQSTPNLINKLGLQVGKSSRPPLPGSIRKRPRVYRKRHYERNDRRTQRCRHCRVLKSGPEFNSDSSRSSGLSSGCRECASFLNRIRYKMMNRGGTSAEAYAEFKQIMRLMNIVRGTEA